MQNYKINLSNDFKKFIAKIFFLFLYKTLLSFFLFKWLSLGDYYFLSLDINIKKFYIGLVFFLLSIFFLKNNFINRLILIIILFLLYPSLALFEVTNFSIYVLVITFVSLFIIYIFSNLLFLNLKILTKFKIISFKKSYYICCILVLAYIFYIFFQIDFRNELITDLRKFSDYRYMLNFKDEVYYFNSVITVSILPYILILSLYQKKYVLSGIFVALYFFLAIIFMSKVLLFIPLMSIFVYFCFNSRYFFFLMLGSPIVLLILSLIEFEMLVKYNGIIDYFGSGVFGNYAIRRIIIIPSVVNFSYLEYFSYNNFLYWGESKASLGLNNQLKFLPGSEKRVGNFFFLDTYSVNSGLIGSGYANLGIWGVAIYSFLAGLLFSLLNSISQNIKCKIVYSVFFTNIFYIFLIADLLAIFNTYGLLLLILIIMLTDFKEDKSLNQPLKIKNKRT